MKKLIFLLVLVLPCLTACVNELETQAENKDAVLKEIGQSEAFIKMTLALDQSKDVYMNMDRNRYVAVMEKAGYGMCDVWEKGIPAEIYEIEGAMDYLKIMRGYCEARDQVNRTYPDFWNMPHEDRLKVFAYRNQAVGFNPASQLAEK